MARKASSYESSGLWSENICRILVCRFEVGQESYAYSGTTDGHNGVSCMLFQTAGSNATEVNNQINRFLEEARKELPQGVELTQLMSSNDFLYASIHEVVKTLLEAILLVILVVYVFLQDIRSTLIPLVGIIVSLIGTFAFMAIAGHERYGDKNCHEHQ